MGSGLTDFWAHELLDHALGQGAYSPPAKLYLALSTADPGQDGSGLTEPGAGVNYARIEVTGYFPNAASRQSATDTNITFVAATGTWGTITHVCLLDDPTAGNKLSAGPILVPKYVTTGDVFQIDSGDLTLALCWGLI